MAQRKTKILQQKTKRIMKRTIKFREWDGIKMNYDPKVWLISSAPMNDRFEDNDMMEYSGFNDSEGKEIYEGDIVYIAGQGDTVIEFPFTELVYAYPEGDIGEIKGNIHETPNLIPF